MNNEVTRILLADDHAVLRAGLRALLNIEPDITVIGEAGNGNETLEQIEVLQPDIVVLDLMMPQVKGLDIIEQITRTYPHTRVLVLTMHAESQYIRHVMQAGGAGYVLKSAADTELISAIREIANGNSYLTPGVTNVLLADYREQHQEPELTQPTDLDLLSDREREVLIMTALGYSSKEMGEMLFISPKTVDTYRQRVMDKLQLESRAELVQYALKHELLEAK
ncbi:response regulator transcription factor [Phototrophicus methaneseepsis]|uniref:Response regulator transcription factor n=1 Tax=Phototrophicus methaneseepsis TaxID=2710758 RepID=A0A7S8ECM1_9CHLR|nr:response regulator transcription factor [Phototrophicus methaneseepsis]QPC84474.1 response regulator transcription factor [Phototrophicus methaneseepsis]